MGCDIHAMYEGTKEPPDTKWRWWINEGSPKQERNYHVFGILAGVRHDPKEMGIAGTRPPEWAEAEEELDYRDPAFREKFNAIFDGTFSSPFKSWLMDWWGDAHTVGYCTLQDLELYCAKNSEAFKEYWLETRAEIWRLVEDMTVIALRNGYDKRSVRLVFFFDN